MSHFIHLAGERTLAVTISGVMRRADRAAFEDAARDLIGKVGRINALILLKEFEGVGRDVDMNDLDFYATHGDDIVKMAIVGDPKWETQASLFTGRGARQTDVRFFPMHEFGSAQQWVAS